MPQLIVRNVEQRLVRKLKQRAGNHGISMEEEHRRILRDALLGETGAKLSFKDYLLQMPDLRDDELFARRSDRPRKVRL